MSEPRIVFVCGGTGGHVYPAIALAQRLEGYNPLFIGSTHRMDSRIVPKYGFSYEGIPESKWRLATFIKLFFKSRNILKKHAVKAMVGAGGFYTFAVVMAAFSLKIPVFLLEQNVIPGRTNRMLQYFARKIYLSFPESLSYFSSCDALVTGNPVRHFFLEDDVFTLFKELVFPAHPVVLFFGGSQGAMALNQLVFDHYSYFLHQPFVAIHVTGQTYYDAHFHEPKVTVYRNDDSEIKIVSMPYFEKMDELYRRAALVICRSGAMTLSEIEAFHVPVIMVPYPYSKDNHQVANAKVFQEKGFGVYFEEKALQFSDIQAYFSHPQDLLTASAHEDSSADTLLKDLYGILRTDY